MNAAAMRFLGMGELKHSKHCVHSAVHTCEKLESNGLVLTQLVLVALSWCVRIWGECLTIFYRPVHFFF